MHLEDFSTKRKEIEVFCGSHIPEKSERKDGVLWYIGCGKTRSRIFVRSLTENAKKHWKGNCYNGECEPIEIFGKELKKDKNK